MLVVDPSKSEKPDIEADQQLPTPNLDQLLSPLSLSNMVKLELNDALAQLGGVHALGKHLGNQDLTKGFSDTSDKHVFEQNKVKYGVNYLEPDPLPSYLWLIWEGMHDATMVMLMLAGLISFILGLGFDEDKTVAWVEGLAIFLAVVVVLNIQAGTDYTKAKTFRRQQLELENQESVFVFRNNGECFPVNPKDIIVGDVVKIQSGDVLSVDGVLIDGNAKMDYSALTGESKLIDKDAVEFPFMMSGTSVMDGRGRMLVVAVGPNSVQGQILVEVNKQKEEKTTTTTTGLHNEDVEAGGGVPAPVAKTCASRWCWCRCNRASVKGGWKACGSFWKAFFTFGKIDQGGTLVEKLDRVAIDIGKFGLIVATIVFLVLIMRWSITVFGMSEFCNPNNCVYPCSNATSVDSACVRQWNGAEDGMVLVSFFITAVTILVVAVPEGLPLAVTLSLRVAMQRMAKDQNNVKLLESVETMGSATSICSDKTGTLTTNKMTVVRVGFLLDKFVLFSPTNEQSLGECARQENVEVLSESLSVCADPTSSVVKSDATTSSSGFTTSGNATECALLRLCVEMGVDYSTQRVNKYGNQMDGLDWGVHSMPFSSSRKQMSWTVRLPSGQYRIYAKGAPGAILEQCTQVFSHSTQTCVELSPLLRAEMESKISDMQDSAMRTLATAFLDLKEEWHKDLVLPSTDFVLVSILGIEDPLRPGVSDAMIKCRNAGVDVRMCTGDSLPTAVAISLQCGILRSDVDLVENADGKMVAKPGFAMTGAELDERVHEVDVTQPKVIRRYFDIATQTEYAQRLAHPFKLRKEKKVLNQKAFDSVWPKLRVLARCLPEDKLTLVRGMRRSKVFLQHDFTQELHDEFKIDVFPDFQVVAVTGDGTNDAMALKEADVGFAMGIAGTKICKRASDIIIMDDNFTSIVAAVKWGRNVFDSISKFIQFQLTVNVVAITIASIGAFVYEASPLRALQMLWINMIMDTAASLALATEMPKEELLQRPPYGKRRPIVSTVMYYFIGLHASYQIAVLFAILFAPTEWIPDNVPFFPQSNSVHAESTASVHWTIVFNTFVMMTLANEFNARKLPTVDRLRTHWQEWNVFEGLLSNPIFCVIVLFSLAFQVILVQLCGIVFVVMPLTANQWGFCIGWGLSVIPFQFVVNGIILLHFRLFPPKTQTLQFEFDPEEHLDEEERNEIVEQQGFGGRVSILETAKDVSMKDGHLIDRVDVDVVPWNKERMLADEKFLVSKHSVHLEEEFIQVVGRQMIPPRKSKTADE